MKKILTWLKANIMLLCIICVVILCSIILISLVINYFGNKEGTNNKYITMLCSNEYEDGEKVSLEFVYDNTGKNLKKHKLIHTEIGLSEEDVRFCDRFNLLSGVSCSFQRKSEPYKYTVEINIEEFDEESYEVIYGYEIYSDLLPLSMIDAKKYLLENKSYNGMVCKIIDEKGNVIEKEKNIFSKNNDNTDLLYEQYVGEYYNSTNPLPTDTYILKLKTNGTYSALVNFGISSSELSGTYTINGNTLVLSSSCEDENTKIDETIFMIDDNTLTFKSGGIGDEIAQNIGCATGKFDCSLVKVLYKK